MSDFYRIGFKPLRNLIVGSAFVFFSSTALAYDYKYEVVEIPNDFNLGFGINDLGMVTGYSDNAFVYDGFNVKDLGTLGGFLSIGQDINNSGFVTGASLTSNFDFHAFFYDGAKMNDIGTLYGGSSFGQGINDSGLVVGYSSASSDINDTRNTAFLYDSNNNSISDIGALIAGSDESYAVSINNSGFVTGSSFNAAGEENAFILDTSSSSVINLGELLGGTFSTAFDINDLGWVVGYGDNALGVNNAFLYDGGSELMNLGSLGGGASQAYALNDFGYVVGESDGAAFLWQSGSMIDLNTLIDNSLGINLSYAEDINDFGQILAVDSDLGKSYILNPVASAVPEPSSMSLMLGGMGLIGYLVARRKVAFSKTDS